MDCSSSDSDPLAQFIVSQSCAVLYSLHMPFRFPLGVFGPNQRNKQLVVVHEVQIGNLPSGLTSMHAVDIDAGYGSIIREMIVVFPYRDRITITVSNFSDP